MRWLNEQAPPPPSAPRIGAGYYLRDAELLATDDQGRPRYRVSAAFASQRLEDGAVELDEVGLLYAPTSELPWRLTATAGRMPPGGKLLQLLGDVVATAQDRGGVAATIRSDYLEVDTETYVAFTERPVEVVFDGGQLAATGLRAYLREGRLQLLSDVHGQFIPD